MLDKLGRPYWDDYFMAMAFLVATRSLDPRTKHGCILVSKKNRIISLGYNSPPAGVDDQFVPLEAPAKYLYMEHAERNAIYNTNSSLEGATAYITGFPCIQCLRALIQKGIKKIVYGPTQTISLEGNENEAKAVENILNWNKDLKIVFYNHYDFLQTYQLLFTYMISKKMPIDTLLK